MGWYNLVYITFPRILVKDVSSETGLKFLISVLSLFYERFFFRKFYSGGKIPD